MMWTWIASMALLLVADVDSAQWVPQESGTKARIRGLGVVSPDVAWAGGAGGTCLRTTDRGKTWTVSSPPGTSALDFRDVHAIDAESVFLLSIGAGELSRI